MSRFITENKDETYLEEIESIEICKWRYNEVCCNDECDCVGDYPNSVYIDCKCNSIKECKHFEKEDGIIN
jgi:hypothetical protein